MHPDTISGLRRKHDEPLPDRLDRLGRDAAKREAAREAAEFDRHAIVQPSLPSASTVDLVTMTLDELHDTIYQAVSTHLQRTPMTKAKAQAHAATAADLGQQIVRVHGWTHRGQDPRE